MEEGGEGYMLRRRSESDSPLFYQDIFFAPEGVARRLEKRAKAWESGGEALDVEKEERERAIGGGRG